MFGIAKDAQAQNITRETLRMAWEFRLWQQNGQQCGIFVYFVNWELTQLNKQDAIYKHTIHMKCV